MERQQRKALGNQILNSIPEEEDNPIRADLEYVETPRHQILPEAGDKIQHAYFLNKGMASLVVFNQ